MNARHLKYILFVHYTFTQCLGSCCYTLSQWLSRDIKIRSGRSGKCFVVSCKTLIIRVFFCKESGVILLLCLMYVELMDFHET